MKIVQIDGVKGVITAVFMGACLFSGFVLCPGYAAMSLWNKYLVNLYMFPTLNLFQGVLLWGIAVITYCILSKKGFAISFKNTPELSDAELNSIIQRAKIDSRMRMMNTMISKTDKFEVRKENIVKSTSVEKESLVSSPISISSKKESAEKSENKDISKIK